MMYKLWTEVDRLSYARELLTKFLEARELHRKGESFWKEANARLGELICEIDGAILYYGIWPKDRRYICNDTRSTLLREITG